MARATISKKDLPGTAQVVVDRVELLGHGWSYAASRPLADTARRVQVRDEEALAPPREVAKYAQLLRKGVRMPPVIITRDGYLVDGSTRTEAARKIGLVTFPAVILDVNYENAPETMVHDLIILGAAFNLSHGRGMSAANVERVIAQVADEDDSPAELARKLGISSSTATTVINMMKARKKAAALGVKLDESLSISHLKLLGGKLAKYTDPVMRELMLLTQDAKLSTPDAVSLCRRLEALSTEPARLEALEAERASYAEVINGDGNPQPSRAAKLRQALGYLIKQSDPARLIEMAPAARANHVRVLDAASRQLQAVIAAQREFDRSQQVKA